MHVHLGSWGALTFYFVAGQVAYDQIIKGQPSFVCSMPGAEQEIVRDSGADVSREGGVEPARR